MDKKKLISEDLKRYRQLLEYTFYVPEDEEKEEDENLLFDGMYITEQDPAGEEEEVPAEDPFAAPPAGETPDVGAEDDVETDVAVEEPVSGEDPFGTGAEVEDEFAVEEPMGGEETVEVDVTELVDKADETKTSVEGVNTKMDELLAKLSELESQVSGMDNVINKIDDLEKEIERRNPTPVERLEMRSMDSFPYSVKLTDFWKDKEGYEPKEEEEEFTLRQSDVDNFDEKQIRASFNSNSDEEKN